MERPDPANSRIRDMFVNKFSGRSDVDELEALKQQGPLLFTEDDPIFTSAEPLDRLAVQLCTKQHITFKYFEEKYKLYAIRMLGYHPQQASTCRSNMLKMMRKGHITWRRFFEFCCRVLELPLERVMFQFDLPSNREKCTIEVSGLSRNPIPLTDDDEE